MDSLLKALIVVGGVGLAMMGVGILKNRRYRRKLQTALRDRAHRSYTDIAHKMYTLMQVHGVHHPEVKKAMVQTIIAWGQWQEQLPSHARRPLEDSRHQLEAARLALYDLPQVSTLFH